MASILAVVSKKVFEAQARGVNAVLGIGDVWDTGHYASAHAAFAPLKEGGDLFLVTVRPPNEQLWLVAVLRTPRFNGQGWIATKNQVRITDITPLRAQITFANGATITAEKGKLGMSLQTPRALSPAAIQLLCERVGISVGVPRRSIDRTAEPIHLNRHEQGGPLPCLCRRCFRADLETVEASGLEFMRSRACAGGRMLYYWLPTVLAGRDREVQQAVENHLRERYRRRVKA